MGNNFSGGYWSSRLSFLFLCLAFSAAIDANTLTILGKYDGTAYRTEFEITSDPGAYVAVGVDIGGSTEALEPDSGEAQWDIESDNISLGELNSLLGANIIFRIFTGDISSPIESVYAVAPSVTTPLVNADFPDRGANLDVAPGVNPFRPTATWTGGDSTADALFLTYQDLTTLDEFGDPSLDPSANPTSYTIQQDLLPGTYEATLAFWALDANPALTLQSGPDVFTPAADDVSFVLVGETLFSPVFVVPVPAAAFLFPSGLWAGLAWMRRRRT